MDAKLALVFIFTLLVLLDVAQAEFFFNRKLPKQRELKALGLKCIPGRTVIKMKEKSEEPEAEDDGDSDDDARRSHMRFKTDDESCQVCVCSVEAKDEYCSNRPAMNVNECMRMAVLMSQFENGEAYDHERALAYMIRRVGDGSTNVNSQRCTPFVSMYSDCTDDNRCEGCSRCTCTAAGTWSCATVTDGCQELQEEDKEVIDDELIDSALDEMLTELQPPETSTKIETEYVPKPSPPPEKILGYILALPRETH